MRKLSMPTWTVESVLTECATHIRDKHYAKRLRSVLPTVSKAEKTYRNKGKSFQLFSIKPQDSIENCVSIDEMMRLYSSTLSGKKSPVRYIYDDLKAAARNGICPLCCQRPVSTLDHYLAKSRHPALAVTPANLIPACFDCNKAKSDVQPTAASEQTLHPYFDNSDDHVWLIASVVETKPPALRFEVLASKKRPDLKRDRISTHFKVFNLGQLYASYAAEELLHISYRLSKIAKNEGSAGISKYLTDSLESYQFISKNSWQVAMYDALRTSQWFCTKGFRLVQ